MDFEKLAEGLVAFRKEAKVPRYVRKLLRSGTPMKGIDPESDLGKYVLRAANRRDRAMEVRKVKMEAADDIRRHTKAVDTYSKMPSLDKSQKADMQMRKKLKRIASSRLNAASKGRLNPVYDTSLEGIRNERSLNRSVPRFSDDMWNKRVNDYLNRGRGRRRKVLDVFFPGKKLGRKEELLDKLVRSGRVSPRGAKEQLKVDRQLAYSRRKGAIGLTALGGTTLLAGGGYAMHKRRRTNKKENGR